MDKLQNSAHRRQDAQTEAIARLAEQMRLVRQARAARKLAEIVERQRREGASS